jgi:hypothetical protein
MAFMVPFYLVLRPDEKLNFRGLILSDERDIPDDSYQFEEWYCPNPDCECFQGLLQVFAIQQNSYPAHVYVPFDPTQLPFLNPVYPITPTALALLEVITQHLQEDPAYLKRLRDHYWLVRSVAANPKHPAYPALTYWATNGAATPSSKPRRKKR